MIEGIQEETQSIWKMDRTVPPEVTVAEDAGAAANVADKVRRPGKDSRYKAHSQGRKAHKMLERHRRLHYRHRVQVRRSLVHKPRPATSRWPASWGAATPSAQWRPRAAEAWRICRPAT